jgi:hypothetical protein
LSAAICDRMSGRTGWLFYKGENPPCFRRRRCELQALLYQTALGDGFLRGRPLKSDLAGLKTINWDQLRDETFLITAGESGPEVEDYIVGELAGPIRTISNLTGIFRQRLSLRFRSRP